MGGDSNPLTGAVPFAGNPNVLEGGTIIAVDANSRVYRVHTSSGRTQYMSRIQAHPGDIALLPLHTRVLVTYGLGIPYILGIIPDAGRQTQNTEPESLTGTSGHGGEDPLLARSATSGARGADEPRDLIPGDMALRSPDGASIAALRGRVAQVKGSDVAKIEAFGGSDLVRIVAGVLQTITWMGESKTVNNDGKTSFIWDGGSDQLTQTGQDEGQFTIHVRLGHEGNLARFEITNREGQPMFNVHVGPDGALRVFGRRGADVHMGSDPEDAHHFAYVGSCTEEITGNSLRDIGGDSSTTVAGSMTCDIEHNRTCYVGGDDFCQVTQNQNITVAQNAEHLIQGSRSVFVGETSTHEVIGSGIYGVKTSGGAMEFATRGGQCRFQTGAGNFTVDTSGAIKLQAGAESIELGRNATSHATKFEELQTALSVLTQQVSAHNTLLTSHVHPVTAPGTTGPSPTLLPLATALSVNIIAAKSTTTKVE